MPTLNFVPALERLDLVSPTVAAILRTWPDSQSVQEIEVAEIDSAFTGSAEFCVNYGVSPAAGSNCVIVAAVRGEKRTLAACVAPISCKMDINGIARKTLDARKVSFAPREEVIQATQMEYGGITSIGLPPGWPILLDERVALAPKIIVGAGIVGAKLQLPGKLLAKLPGAQVVQGLGIEI